MLWTIFVILLVLWLLGMVSYTRSVGTSTFFSWWPSSWC